MIQFILNNKVVKTSTNSGLTLLDFIREHQQLKGTKIGCREGDCGACTVLVGTLNGDDVNYQSITSCLSPLGNANGKHIVTIEGINLPTALNAVQKAMTDNYATQCGFCTPGFVLSITGFALANNKSRRCNDAISGNICRCTGYKSIEKAGLAIEQKLHQEEELHSIAWLIKEGFIPDYFEYIPQKLKALQYSTSSALTSLPTASVEQFSKTTKVANGTDLYVHHADKMAAQDVHLLVDEPALKGISFSDGICTLGANTTATEIAENKQLQSLFPRLKQFFKLVSSEPIRNMGTLGGNFVNASPIGDMSIFFLALNATLTIMNEDGKERQIPFQSFHRDYKVYDLQKHEILKNISFDIPTANEFFNFEKVSKRTHLDIASVNSAGRIEVSNGIITQAHFSVGGVAAIPKYLFKTNEYLLGKAMNSKTVSDAAEVLQSEISPISDVRGTSAYKRLLARQLFFAHFLELFPTQMEFDKLMAS
ncbi:MAG: FAD binding domain-containing protein [Lewinella sp.]|uniref:FAD binding domain-containing protein n=1 Tax=Lewinella sp. TaxID=2004506 RepID=UPI003D6B0C13